MFKAGFDRVDITPELGVHLGGYFTLRTRPAKSVWDPLFVRAIALSDGAQSVCLVVYDILIVTHEISRLLRKALEDTGAKVVAGATHTHSAMGGYWNTKAARMSLGAYDERVVATLVDAGCRAARGALRDMGEAKMRALSGQLDDHGINRRDTSAGADNAFVALQLERSDGKALLCGYGAHPVIAAEHAFNAVSADFPGHVCRELEEEADFAVFFNGALAASGTHLDKKGSTLDSDLEKQARPIVDAAKRVAMQPAVSPSRLTHVATEITLPDALDARSAFDDQTLARPVLWVLDRIAAKLFADSRFDTVRMQAIGLDDVLLLGTPADLGGNVAQAMRDQARACGYAHPFVCSQWDGYVGYVHRAGDYARRPDGETLLMALYENVMGVYGRELGETLIAEAERMLGDATSNPAQSSSATA